MLWRYIEVAYVSLSQATCGTDSICPNTVGRESELELTSANCVTLFARIVVSVVLVISPLLGDNFFTSYPEYNNVIIIVRSLLMIRL